MKKNISIIEIEDNIGKMIGITSILQAFSLSGEFDDKYCESFELIQQNLNLITTDFKQVVNQLSDKGTL